MRGGLRWGSASSPSTSMAPARRMMNRTPFEDLTNSTSADVSPNTDSYPATSNLQQTPIDPKERKKQRARERYAQMDAQKREELLRRLRETYKHQKAVAGLVNQPTPRSLTSQTCQIGTNQSMISSLEDKKGGDASSSLNMKNNGRVVDNEWLRRNDSYQRQTVHMLSQDQECLNTDTDGINSTNCERPIESTVRPAIKDPKERKRQRYKEWYAQNKSEANKNRT